MSRAILADFRSYTFSYADMSHNVYTIGDALPIMVLHELPGLGRSVVDFGRRLLKAGFQVHLPHLFGTIGKRQAYKNYRSLCISREFSNLATGISAPVTFWLRGLANEISKQNAGSPVGAIGMCLTGAFVIPLVLEPCVAAPVSSQPAVPLSELYFFTGLGGTDWARQLNVSEDDIAGAARRLAADSLTLLAFRFEEDRLCPRARFERLEQASGAQLEAHEYGGCSFIRKCFAPRHSVLTEEYSKSPSSVRIGPSHQAFERLCAFMRKNLTRN
jgi:dienelactone hydrolase